MAHSTRHAIILAAGFGSRLQPDEGHKILVEVQGRPMLDYHLEHFSELGVTDITVVTGFESAALRDELEAWSLPHGVRLHTAFNPDFESGNGQSVLAGVEAARDSLGDAAVPFWLTMSDHLLAPGIFRDLRSDWAPSDTTGVMLAVDQKLETIFDMPDANKVRFEDGSLAEIGKEIDPFDCVDVGLFWCGMPFVDALYAELDARGDCNTSDAMRRLADRGQAEFWEIGDHLWQDVDTPEARAHAESLALS